MKSMIHLENSIHKEKRVRMNMLRWVNHLVKLNSNIERALIDKKEYLFKKKELNKWGGFKDDEEMAKVKDQIINDKK
jgi:hypothetical protein